MVTFNSANFLSSAPVHSWVFSFEQDYTPKRARKWMSENLWISFVFIGIYVFLIFSIQFWMRKKPRYELRSALTLWNIALSVFSVLGALRVVPELYQMVTNHGFYNSVCYPIVLEPINTIEFWIWLFTLSKIPELGDTMFIVLRKRPLVFLHWYHHISTLLYAWITFSENISYYRWFISMNYVIHTFMYSYYTLQTVDFPVPKFVAMSITFWQIVQMIIGCTVISAGLYYRLNDQPCQVSYKNIVLGGCMYFSYFALFSRLFYKKYFSLSKKYSLVPDNTKIKGK